MSRYGYSSLQERPAIYERTPPRYELKLPLHGVDGATVAAWVRLHSAHWRVSYPPRQVNNVYFDSPDLRALHANLDGVGERAKLRLRWYGPSLAEVVQPHLELKRRQGGVGWKEIIRLEAGMGYPLTAPTTWSDVRRRLAATAPARVQSWLAAYSLPVLVSHYRRAYYETPDGALRLTLDTYLRAYPQGGALRPNLTRPLPDAPPQVVLELKAPPEQATRLSDAVAAFPGGVARFSKYVQALSAAWGLPTGETV